MPDTKQFFSRDFLLDLSTTGSAIDCNNAHDAAALYDTIVETWGSYSHDPLVERWLSLGRQVPNTFWDCVSPELRDAVRDNYIY